VGAAAWAGQVAGAAAWVGQAEALVPAVPRPAALAVLLLAGPLLANRRPSDYSSSEGT
jgi:hypothetical protein